MISPTSAKYARALAEVALEQGCEDQVRTELLGFNETLASHEEFRTALASPVFPLDVKRSILEKVAAKLVTLKIVKNFLLLLLERNRIHQTPEIVSSYEEILDKRAGLCVISVCSSHELRGELKERLTKALAEMTGKQVKLDYTTDDTLIGGLKIQIGSEVYDGTIRTQLEELGRRLAVAT